MAKAMGSFLFFMKIISGSYGQKKEQEISRKWLDCNV